MALLRVLSVSLFAPVGGCAIASLVLFAELSRASFVPLPFLMAGSVFLLAPIYAALSQSGWPMAVRYLALAGAGIIGGGIFLAFISMGRTILFGSVYGLVTALCWISLNAVLRRLFPVGQSQTTN